MNQYYCKGCNQVIWRNNKEDKLKSFCDTTGKYVMLIKVKVEPLASAQDKPKDPKSISYLETGVRSRKEILSEMRKIEKKKEENLNKVTDKKISAGAKLGLFLQIPHFTAQIDTLKWVLGKQKYL